VAERRHLVTVVAAVLSLAVTTGCAGVPRSGAVHRLSLPQDPQVVAGVAQVAQGPQRHQTQEQVVDSLLLAMSSVEHPRDLPVVEEYLTPDYQPKWEATVAQQTIVFSGRGPTKVTKPANQLQVQLNQTGSIDSSYTYTSASVQFPVTFTLQQNSQGDWRVSNISQTGLFIQEVDLPDVQTPWHVYFPSSAANPAGVPRLVPDTVFLPPDSTASDLLAQLLGGPSSWLEPAVYVTVPPNLATKVLFVQPDPRSQQTIVNLHVATPLDAGKIATLKAQLAYTLNVHGKILLELDGTPAGAPFSLSQLPSGYDPDVLSANAPVYYVSSDNSVVASTPASQAVPGGVPGSSSAPLPDVKETVLEHSDGVEQIGVASPTDVDGVATQLLAGVRSSGGTATLELSSANDPSEHPWTAVTLPVAKSLTTPSFDVSGTGVWTVATAENGTTTVYRVPLDGGVPGVPVAVDVRRDPGVLVTGVTAFRLSRDASRAVLVVGGQADVGVVNHPPTADGGPWSITGLRPVVTVDPNTADVDVFWADRSDVGVVIRTTTTKSPTAATTSVVRVSSDGYTVSADGSTEPVPIQGAPADPAVQLAAGPGQQWVASVHGKLTRQPATDSSTDLSSQTQSPWTPMGEGSYPTYAG
jgi:hypothetical protein